MSGKDACARPTGGTPRPAREALLRKLAAFRRRPGALATTSRSAIHHGHLCRTLLAAVALVGCGGHDDDVEPAPGSPVAAQLDGAYELTWNEEGPGRARQELPASLIGQLPGCIWARWGWDFESDGRLTISNEMLCASPPELGVGHGVCRAEVTTAVEWRDGGFSLPVPVRATSRFVNLRPNASGTIDSATVRCNVSVSAMEATLEDVVASDDPDRPTEVTLVLGDGARMHLRRVDDPEVDHRGIIAEHASP